MGARYLGVYMYVDASELCGLLEYMASKLTPENFDRLMRRSLNEVGKRSRKPIREAVMSQYEVPAGWVNNGIKNAIISGGGGSIICRIPLISAKGKIGGVFGAGGGGPGWATRYAKFPVTAKIVKGATSVLPSIMYSYGGQPPFINTSCGFGPATRAGADRGPVMSIAGLALPQMPMNRAYPETEAKIVALTEKRVLHNFSHMFG